MIAISGRIGSGKDTVGLIIQYLVANNKNPQDYPILDIYLKDKFQQYNAELISGFKVKKFADKLKDIVCILLGCTREQLESHEFKNKELGEEWWYYESKEFGNLYDYLEYKDTRLPSSNLYKLIKSTPRLILQLLGTNCGRDIIHPNIWVNALMSEYIPKYINDTTGKETLEGNYNYHQSGLDENSIPVSKIYPKWIITDMHFPNELKAVKDRGGVTIRVNRDKGNPVVTYDKAYTNAQSILANKYGIETSEYPEEVSIKDDSNLYDKNGLLPIYAEEFNNLVNSYVEKEIVEHPSETALDNAEFDYTINNNGTIEDLVKEVQRILTDIGIL